MQRVLALAALMAMSGGNAVSWRGEIIYQVMPDRFFNGDKANDGVVRRDDPKAWHGGDLTGLIQKLPYIRELGATSVWLTPVYEQMPGTFDGATGYHGYWPQNFRNVDSRFGTLDDFRAFTRAAHGAGMKVVLDQVVNHFGYTAPFVRQNPGWFNDPSSCAGKGDNDVFCPIFGLPDLAQQQPEVRRFLFENADFWRRLGVDGFRYDAIKHVPRDFLRELLSRDASANTFTLGEYFDADPGIVAEYQQLGFRSLFNFALQGAMRQSIMSGQGLDGVRAMLERQDEIPEPDQVALFLDNHDVPRFANGTPFEDVGRERTVYGVRALMTLRGIPVIWQGTEIAMRGGGDPDNRRDMRFSDVWTPDERAVYEAVKGAIATRKSSSALSVGNLKLLATPARLASDLLLFTRENGQQRVLVAWHNGRERRTVALRSTVAARISALRGDLFGQDAKLSVQGGVVYLSLPPRTAVAFELD
ncbi:alpha-amylase family glycosyl hydrolase [Deinococcus peraridilitoris]|uniref:Alpha-amylase n=1 Tax=Deinococcus peraridilitoris (strain DSM 19664 / LMG 22246 / CIP 109416 / KR-200) TaxID=937777 RepID=L0A7K8_DEIPD|nr:alpha-amylase family glycosyl hydrolase [Deinococcus peraridilitoris]AFZ69147.1 glycosidase [Deinococcus peraridilitoris DSM 19664]